MVGDPVKPDNSPKNFNFKVRLFNDSEGNKCISPLPGAFTFIFNKSIKELFPISCNKIPFFR